MKKILNWGLLIGWMCFIFYMSHQSGETSSEASGVIEQFLSIIPFVPTTLLGIELEVLIRKAAHLTEYFILAMLALNVLVMYYDSKRSLALSLIVVFIYACTDEYHQTFIAGRAGALSDVYIDTAGGGLFILVRSGVNAIIKWRAKIKGKATVM